MIRRNKLTLEHIMHQRGKNQVEDNILIKLHVQLRDIEKKLKPQSIITVTAANNTL